MNKPFETARALEAIRAQQAALKGRRQELERRARAASGPTQNRAWYLMTKALLTLLRNDEPVTMQTLAREIERQTRDRDRFAAELCGDWLKEVRRVIGETTR